jgi:hypothetical protein
MRPVSIPSNVASTHPDGLVCQTAFQVSALTKHRPCECVSVSSVQRRTVSTVLSWAKLI